MKSTRTNWIGALCILLAATASFAQNSAQSELKLELMYDQNQRDVLKYAHAIVDNGLPPGVLMIDDNWQEDYGKWTFHPGRFPDPKAMMNELHALGFKVMVWVCPDLIGGGEFTSFLDQATIDQDLIVTERQP